MTAGSVLIKEQAGNILVIMSKSGTRVIFVGQPIAWLTGR